VGTGCSKKTSDRTVKVGLKHFQGEKRHSLDEKGLGEVMWGNGEEKGKSHKFNFVKTAHCVERRIGKGGSGGLSSNKECKDTEKRGSRVR